MSYQDYLQSDWWKERKAKFKAKTHIRCFICRTKDRPLHVHHKRYRRKDGSSVLFNEDHRDLRLLCDRCHETLHRLGLEDYFTRNQIKRRVLRNLLRQNYRQ